MDGIKHDNIYSIAAVHRGDETVLFVGTEPAELFRSDDLGRSCREISTMRSVPNTHLCNFPPPPHIAHCKNVSWHPSNPTTYYVCVKQGALPLTKDDGETWVELEGYEDAVKDKFRHDVHRVLITPSNPDQLLLVIGEGCYVSTDAGVHFEKVTDRFCRIAYPDASFIDPRNEDVVYMGGPNDPPVGWGGYRCAYSTVMRSTDNGRTWSEINRGMPDPVRSNIESMGLYHYADHIRKPAAATKIAVPETTVA